QSDLESLDVFGRDHIEPRPAEDWNQLNAADRFLGRDAVRCEKSVDARSPDDRRIRRTRRQLVGRHSTQTLWGTISKGAGLHCASLSGTLYAMNSLPPPLAFVVLLFAGWVNRQQQAVIDYLLEENRVRRAAHGPRRVRLTDDQRRRLAVNGKVLG